MQIVYIYSVVSLIYDTWEGVAWIIFANWRRIWRAYAFVTRSYVFLRWQLIRVLYTSSLEIMADVKVF